jgi:NAD(P) transhydrogenase subunit alpha
VKVDLEEDTQTSGGYAKEVSEEAKKREQEVIKEHVQQADVVITTAQVPGRKAPVLITEDMVSGMRPGSVIVDLAAEQGGNCELTNTGEETLVHDVKILGVVNLPSTMPVHASQMYAKNVSTLLQHLTKEGEIVLDFEDEITDKTCVTHDGVIRNDRVRQSLD